MAPPTTFVPKSGRPPNQRSHSSPARSSGFSGGMRMEVGPGVSADAPLRPGETLAPSNVNVTSSRRGLPPRVPSESGLANGGGFGRRRRTANGASMGGGPAVPQSEHKGGLGETPDEVFGGPTASSSFDTASAAAGAAGTGKKAPVSIRKRLFRSKSEV